MISKELAKTIGKAVFYSSLQASIGAVEMSSKFSVMNFSTDQETLQRAADALRSYVIIGSIWTLGTVLALYASHGLKGAWIGLGANIIMMGWIIVSYIQAFKEAAKRHGLKEPLVFSKKEWVAFIIFIVLICICIVYMENNNKKQQ